MQSWIILVRLQGTLVTDVPTIRAFSADEWRVYRDLRLRALADSPDAFGSTLAEEAGRLDAEWARRLASGVDSPVNLPLVAAVGGEPIGLAWGRIDTSNPDVAALYQMWVAPSHRLGNSALLIFPFFLGVGGVYDVLIQSRVVAPIHFPEWRSFGLAVFMAGAFLWYWRSTRVRTGAAA